MDVDPMAKYEKLRKHSIESSCVSEGKRGSVYADLSYRHEAQMVNELELEDDV